MPKTARDYVTMWHDYVSSITDKTQVIFLGPSVAKVLHRCQPAKRDGRIEERMIAMWEATNNTAPQGYCRKCDILFVAKDPDERE